MNSRGFCLFILLSCSLMPALISGLAKEKKSGGCRNHSGFIDKQSLTCGVRKAVGSTHRVINGRSAKPGEFPFQALLFIQIEGNPGVMKCSGSIIDEWHILTAAHCVADCDRATLNIAVGIGEHVISRRGDGEVVIKGENFLVHENFDKCKTKIYNDIALVRVDQRMEFKLNKKGYGSVNTICLPKSRQNFKPGDKALISGWGLTSFHPKRDADILQTGEMHILEHEKCAKIWKSNYHLQLESDKHVCLFRGKSKASGCFGDSGSAAAVLIGGKLHILGITSAGSENCDPMVPELFTRVTNYLGWIEKAKKELRKMSEKGETMGR